MAEVTDKEIVQKKRALDSLRDKIVAEKSKASANASAAENQLTMARLDVEEERLQAELEALREANKDSKAVVKETIASVTDEGYAAAGQPDDEPEGDA